MRASTAALLLVIMVVPGPALAGEPDPNAGGLWTVGAMVGDAAAVAVFAGAVAVAVIAAVVVIAGVVAGPGLHGQGEDKRQAAMGVGVDQENPGDEVL